MDASFVIIGGIALVVALVLYLAVVRRSRAVNLTETGEDKPDWMRETPPPETIAATQKDQEKGISSFDYDAGEHMAAPFAEQIEDILHAILEKDPHLKQFEVDLGTGPDGELETGDPWQAIDGVNSNVIDGAAMLAWFKVPRRP